VKQRENRVRRDAEVAELPDGQEGLRVDLDTALKVNTLNDQLLRTQDAFEVKLIR